MPVCRGLPAAERAAIVASVAAPDTIEDFSHKAGDKISFGFAPHSFIGTTAFDGTAGEIRYAFDSTSGPTMVYVDINGDKIADAEVLLMGQHVMVASDFGL